jgi:hypothetical protein
VNFRERLELATKILKEPQARPNVPETPDTQYAVILLSGVLAEVSEHELYFSNPKSKSPYTIRPVTPSQVRANEVAWLIINEYGARHPKKAES